MSYGYTNLLKRSYVDSSGIRRTYNEDGEYIYIPDSNYDGSHLMSSSIGGEFRMGAVGDKKSTTNYSHGRHFAIPNEFTQFRSRSTNSRQHIVADVLPAEASTQLYNFVQASLGVYKFYTNGDFQCHFDKEGYLSAEALSKLFGLVGTIELGVNVLEARDSLRTVIDGANKLSDLIRWALDPRKYRRLGSSFSKDSIYKAAGNDLYFKFGVMPIIDTIRQAISFEPAYDIHMSTKASISESFDLDFSDTQAERTGSVNKRHNLKVLLRIDPNIGTMMQYGLQPSVLYDIIPLSFLVDFVIPIGSYIDALTGYFLFEPVDVSSSVKAELHANCKSVWPYPVEWNETTSSKEWFNYDIYGSWYKRRRLSQLPFPKLQIKNPLDLPISRIITAAEIGALMSKRRS